MKYNSHAAEAYGGSEVLKREHQNEELQLKKLQLELQEKQFQRQAEIDAKRIETEVKREAMQTRKDEMFSHLMETGRRC